MNEYGGYIELETFHGGLFHENAIALNCGRSALAYLCEAKQIRKLYLPRFLCSSVSHLCAKLGIDVEYYPISRDFLPILPKKCSGGGIRSQFLRTAEYFLY